MNITIVIDELGMGGAQHVVHELTKHIDHEKYKVTIICTDGRVHSLLEEQMLKESKEIVYPIIFLKDYNFVKIKTGLKFFDKIINKIRWILTDLIIIKNLEKELKKSKPDIIHAHQHGIWSFPWALINKVPLITTVHTKLEAAFSRPTEQLCLKLSIVLKKNIFAAVSKYNHDLIKQYWKIDSYHVRCINNGIDIHNFYAEKHDIFTYINVSRQDENKNQSLILRALNRLYRENTNIPMKLILVGDGVTHEALKKQAVDLGINSLVTFTGYIADPKDHLALSDVYISSSHREGLPLSALEAMASGLPVIATDAGGIRDLAQENGILIVDDDEEGLYRAMKELRDNPKKLKFMGNKSLEMVCDYSAESMTNSYCLLYDEFAK
jgi:glycosyltransferase involved in cell wall biosynthesis